MGDYIKSKKDKKFQSQDALRTVQSVINDADAALKDKVTIYTQIIVLQERVRSMENEVYPQGTPYFIPFGWTCFAR